MRSALMMAGLGVLAMGCAKNIPVAEGDCSDLLKETFRDASFENEEEEEGLQSLLLGMHEACMTVDLSADASDLAINPGPLTEEYLDGLPVPSGDAENPVALADQTPVGLPGRSSHPLETHVAAMQDSNQNCLGSSSTVYSARTFTSGEDCFFDGSCDKATSEGRSFTKNILAKVWIDSYSDYYRTTMPFEDGEVEAIVSRGWIDQTWRSGQDADGGSEWRQRYILDVYYPDPADPSKTLRMYMFWSEADLPGVGEDLYVSQVLGGLEENYENVDAFFDGEICDYRDLTEEEAREL